MSGKSALLLGIVLANFGCAEPLRLMAQSPVAGPSPCYFWPPAPSTATWIAEPNRDRRTLMGSVAQDLERRLRDAGYAEQRWYPIGSSHEHGFAVTTRLERLDDRTRSASRDRWAALYPEAANLKWLTLARSITLPHPGDYRVWLIAYTDLPIGATKTAPRWNEATMMDGPGARESASARESAVPDRWTVDYRFGIFEYDYQLANGETRGQLQLAGDRARTEAAAGSADWIGMLGALSARK